ncbi:MAG: hypothetical protein LBU65_09960 [Planctomycetaceae bacterium]|nr:hypothetical protein [Planctomycetaceae bacterium]
MSNQSICNLNDKPVSGLSSNQSLILVFVFLLGIASAFVVDKAFLTTPPSGANTAHAAAMP